MICVSAAADDETAKSIPALARGRPDFPSGAFAASFLVAFEVHEKQCTQNWTEMLKIIMNVCKDFRYGQSVQLSSTQNFDLTREFNLHDSIPNSNGNKMGPVTASGNGGFAPWSRPPMKDPCAGRSQEEKLRIMAAHGSQAAAMLLAQLEALKAHNPEAARVAAQLVTLDMA